MLVMEMDSLFPEASSIDIAKVKVLLAKYKKMESSIKEFEKNPPETPKQEQVNEAYKQMTKNITRAINLIIDIEIREIMHYRFIDGNRRKAAIARFSLMTDRTLDRKINEGIESIANTMKLWGEI